MFILSKMQHYAAFHQGLHCLRLKQPPGKEIHHDLETSTCDPLKYIKGSSILLYKYVLENPSEYKGLLSYDVASGSEITPCNKICKPLVFYRFTGNVMTSITTLHT